MSQHVLPCVHEIAKQLESKFVPKVPRETLVEYLLADQSIVRSSMTSRDVFLLLSSKYSEAFVNEMFNVYTMWLEQNLKKTGTKPQLCRDCRLLFQCIS